VVVPGDDAARALILEVFVYRLLLLFVGVSELENLPKAYVWQCGAR